LVKNNELGDIHLVVERGGGGVLRELPGGVGGVKAELWEGMRSEGNT